MDLPGLSRDFLDLRRSLFIHRIRHLLIERIKEQSFFLSLAFESSSPLPIFSPGQTHGFDPFQRLIPIPTEVFSQAGALLLTREGPQVCSADFNENDMGLLSQVYLSQV